MGNQVTAQNTKTVSLPFLPKLSKGLDHLVCRGASDLPETVHPDLIAEASRVLGPYRVYMQDAPKALVAQWLARVGILVAGTMPAADAKIKISAYVDDLHYPAFCYTDETRVAAAEEFKFFPAFSELAEFFGWYVREHRQKLAAIEAATKAKATVIPPEPKWSQLTHEQKAEIDGLLRRFYAGAVISDAREGNHAI